MKVEGQSPAAPPGLGMRGRPREFGKKQQNPVRRFGGIGAVIVLHILLVYALINGLANKIVHVIQRPIETKIIEPVKPPPPPPLPVVQLPPPKFTPPPPPFVPPPEVPVQAPPQQTIVHQATPTPTPQAVPPAPPAPPVKSPPVQTAVSVVCPNSDEVRSSVVYPKEAQENGDTGDVVIEFTVDPQGHVSNERVAKSSDHDSLDDAAFRAVKKFNCIAQGQAVRVQVPFSFNLN
ncbi:MAG TPA: energy transducer TonB [Trinickia sp.]|uniref:energy transducer TonB n=1 Tax=Trinickia sp. TaxID=2571163 RepID=UPI002C1D55B5|nr:energy transducer TonB [Trinickia sp.]HTI18485.1 energy transducer TonB [Trinickia sp.]